MGGRSTRCKATGFGATSEVFAKTFTLKEYRMFMDGIEFKFSVGGIE